MDEITKDEIEVLSSKLESNLRKVLERFESEPSKYKKAYIVHALEGLVNLIFVD